ncbi:MAG: hypothetical protein LBC61_06605 [Candidatus Peribacteria bacterium]|nr:hypothetical protein [Candidatus Peribacteria bacterium]
MAKPSTTCLSLSKSYFLAYSIIFSLCQIRYLSIKIAFSVLSSALTT